MKNGDFQVAGNGPILRNALLWYPRTVRWVHRIWGLPSNHYNCVKCYMIMEERNVKLASDPSLVHPSICCCCSIKHIMEILNII